MTYPHYYKVLGVKTTASMEDIKQAYRKLAKKYHPDTNQGNKKSEEKLKQITEAYNVLKDYGKRAEYDYLGQQAQTAATSQTPPQTEAQARAAKENITDTSQPHIRYKRSWLQIIWHELFALLCLFLYGWLLYINTDKNDPYNINKTLRNTSNMLVEKISLGWQKSDEFYHSDKWKKKILFFATLQNQPQILDKLLTYWPDANIKDDTGYSLLMRAPTADTARIILNHGADVNYQAPDGQTAFSLAGHNNNIEMVNLLRKHGARIIWKK